MLQRGSRTFRCHIAAAVFLASETARIGRDAQIRSARAVQSTILSELRGRGRPRTAQASGDEGRDRDSTSLRVCHAQSVLLEVGGRKQIELNFIRDVRPPTHI